MIKKLLPLFAVLAAALIIMSTGAFTSITAERAAEINVAGDASALLQLSPAADSKNAMYVDYDNDGALYLNLEDVAGTGVNVDAVTTFDNVFTITNNGTQAVTVTLEKDGDNASAINFGSIEEGVKLAVGGSYTVSFQIDTDEMSKEDNILKTITLTATAE